MLLGNKGLEDSLFGHVANICSHTRDSYLVIILLYLSGFGLLKGVIGIHSRVLGEDKRNLLQGLSESSYGILLHIGNLISLFSKINRAAELRGSTAHNHIRLLDEVSDDAKRVVNGSVSLVNDGLASSSDQNGDCFGMRESFEDDHIVAGGSMLKFFDLSHKSQFVAGELLKSRNDSCSSGHCQKLNVCT